MAPLTLDTTTSKPTQANTSTNAAQAFNATLPAKKMYSEYDIILNKAISLITSEINKNDKSILKSIVDETYVLKYTFNGNKKEKTIHQFNEWFEKSLDINGKGDYFKAFASNIEEKFDANGVLTANPNDLIQPKISNFDNLTNKLNDFKALQTKAGEALKKLEGGSDGRMERFLGIQNIVHAHNMYMLNDPKEPIDPSAVVLYWGTDHEVTMQFRDRNGGEIGVRENGILKRPIYIRVPNDTPFSTIQAMVGQLTTTYNAGNKLNFLKLSSHGYMGGYVSDGNDANGGYKLFKKVIPKTYQGEEAPFHYLSDHLVVDGCEILWDIEEKEINAIRNEAATKNCTMDLNTTVGYMGFSEWLTPDNCFGKQIKLTNDSGPGGNAIRFYPDKRMDWINRKGDIRSALSKANPDCDVRKHYGDLPVVLGVAPSGKIVDETGNELYEEHYNFTVQNGAVIRN